MCAHARALWLKESKLLIYFLVSFPLWEQERERVESGYILRAACNKRRNILVIFRSREFNLFLRVAILITDLAHRRARFDSIAQCVQFIFTEFALSDQMQLEDRVCKGEHSLIESLLKIECYRVCVMRACRVSACAWSQRTITRGVRRPTPDAST